MTNSMKYIVTKKYKWQRSSSWAINRHIGVTKHCRKSKSGKVQCWKAATTATFWHLTAKEMLERDKTVHCSFCSVVKFGFRSVCSKRSRLSDDFKWIDQFSVCFSRSHCNQWIDIVAFNQHFEKHKVGLSVRGKGFEEEEEESPTHQCHAGSSVDYGRSGARRPHQMEPGYCCHCWPVDDNINFDKTYLNVSTKTKYWVILAMPGFWKCPFLPSPLLQTKPFAKFNFIIALIYSTPPSWKQWILLQDLTCWSSSAFCILAHISDWTTLLNCDNIHHCFYPLIPTILHSPSPQICLALFV